MEGLFRKEVELQGHWVRLVPLRAEHAARLLSETRDPEIWRWWRSEPPTTEERLQEWIGHLLRERDAGEALPFTIELVAEEHRAVGMTRFLNISREDRRAEIGGTWIARRLWGTPVNLDAKYLLLRHAFESEGIERVELKTDGRNLRSQRAIEKTGAVREGVLRHHMIAWDGYPRDSVYFSILSGEWPSVKSRLNTILEGRRAPGHSQSPPGGL